MILTECVYIKLFSSQINKNKIRYYYLAWLSKQLVSVGDTCWLVFTRYYYKNFTL